MGGRYKRTSRLSLTQRRSEHDRESGWVFNYLAAIHTGMPEKFLIRTKGSSLFSPRLGSFLWRIPTEQYETRQRVFPVVSDSTNGSGTVHNNRKVAETRKDTFRIFFFTKITFFQGSDKGNYCFSCNSSQTCAHFRELAWSTTKQWNKLF